MSVPKSERGISPVAFVTQTFVIEDLLISFLEKLPKKYFQFYTKPLIEGCNQLSKETILGNEIYPTTLEEFQKRRLHFKEAYAQCVFLTHKLDVLYAKTPVFYKRVSRGDRKIPQSFPSLSEARFRGLISALSEERALLKGILRSDQRRFSSMYRALRLKNVVSRRKGGR